MQRRSWWNWWLHRSRWLDCTRQNADRPQLMWLGSTTSNTQEHQEPSGARSVVVVASCFRKSQCTHWEKRDLVGHLRKLSHVPTTDCLPDLVSQCSNDSEFSTACPRTCQSRCHRHSLKRSSWSLTRRSSTSSLPRGWRSRLSYSWLQPSSVFCLPT